MLPSEFCFPIPFFIFSKVTSHWQEKTWRGDKKGKVQAWIASSPLKFQTHLIPEIISGIFLAFHQEYLFRFCHWKTKEPFLFSLFSFSPFSLSWNTLPFPPFCPVLILNSKLSSKDTRRRPNCISFPNFLLPVTSLEEADAFHKHSQENAS